MTRQRTPQRVLLLTLSFGTGHLMASEAIAEAVRRRDPSTEVKIVDCIQGGSMGFRAFYVWPYWWMIRYAPGLWARLFRARQGKRHRRTAPAWVFRWGCRRVLGTIKQWQPDVILATEVGACEIAVLARQRRITRAPLLAVATDHESEPVWVQEEIDRYFTPTRVVSEQLVRWGVPAGKIVISGIPVHEKFHGVELPRQIAKKKLGLAIDRPLVLVMGGGMGPLRMDDVVRNLVSLPGPLAIVALTGLNSKVRARLERMRMKLPTDKALKIFGWVENVHEFMRAADVLVTKPGGMTLTEAACLGLPLVAVNPIPGPEEIHCRLIEREGLGVVAGTIEQVSTLVLEILKNGPPRREAPPWLRADAAQRIAGIALEYSYVHHVQEETTAVGMEFMCP